MAMMMISIYILIFIIINIQAQTCGEKDPTGFSQCNPDSSTNSICCYAGVKLLDSHQTLCVYVPKAQLFITPFVKSMDIGLSPNNIEIHLDCGFKPGDIAENEPYSICREDPENEKDCFSKSTETASCCYIKNPDGTSVCLLNNGIYKKSETYFGIKVSCNSHNITSAIVFFIVLITLII